LKLQVLRKKPKVALEKGGKILTIIEKGSKNIRKVSYKYAVPTESRKKELK